MDLKSQLDRLLNQVIPELPGSVNKSRIDELLHDIESDFYTVVVVGEFKRGKSTFINALIGEDLLPVDVTPTTATINILAWGKDRSLMVYKKNGQVEEMPLTRQPLARFIMGADFDAEDIDFLKITLPADILKNKVMLVDTPGVDDINQQRVEVTYGFIPRANAVLFLLDATSPVRRTEKEFLQNTILKEGMDNIIFLANFTDYVDQEEREELLEDIKRRLQAAIGRKDPAVYLLSAKQALDARLKGDEVELYESGILDIEAQIKQLIESGDREAQRIEHFKRRLNNIAYDLQQEIRSLIKIQNKTIEQLNEELQEIEKYINKKTRIRAILEEYTAARAKEMQAIVKKSVHNFGEKLRERIMLEVENYEGVDIKGFVEKQLPLKVKTEIKQWYEQYTPAIYKMLQKYEKALVTGLAKEFNIMATRLDVQYEYRQSFDLDVQRNSLYCNDITRTSVVAGAIAGGLSLATILIGIPILFPIVGMASYPVLERMLVERKIQQAKAKLKPMLNYALDDIIAKFSRFIEDMVLNSIRDIEVAAFKRFDEQIKNLQAQFEQEIQKRKENRYQESLKIERLNDAYKVLEDIINDRSF